MGFNFYPSHLRNLGNTKTGKIQPQVNDTKCKNCENQLRVRYVLRYDLMGLNNKNIFHRFHSIKVFLSVCLFSSKYICNYMIFSKTMLLYFNLIYL